MKIVIIILLIAFVIGVLFLLIGSYKGHKKLEHIAFNESSIEFGAKGSGKSLISCEIANICSKKYGYVSNTDFGGLYTHCEPIDISVAPNTWENVMDGKIIPIKENPKFYNSPVILDDCAVYLPNWAEGKLKIKYGSMPLAFALWRHFYDCPIHLNTQAVSRSWKLLREQQECFVLARGVIKLPFFLVVKYRYYDNINSAEMKMKPYKASFGNKFAKAEKESFIAHNGIIKDYFFFVRKSKIKYDSRYFHKVFFGKDTPTKKELKSIKKIKKSS